MFPQWQALIVLDSVRQGLLGSCSDPQSINWLGQVTVERPRKLMHEDEADQLSAGSRKSSESYDQGAVV